MSQEMPYWYKVLSNFEANRYVQNGLTIPFLIGASSILQPEVKLLDISEMVCELCNNDLPKYVSIMRCDNICEYIIGLLDFESEAYLSNYTVFANFVCTDGSFNDIDALLQTLEQEYSVNIDLGKYSKNNGEWSYFSDTDLARLCELT